LAAALENRPAQVLSIEHSHGEVSVLFAGFEQRLHQLLDEQGALTAQDP
jgi:hypothetical protein